MNKFFDGKVAIHCETEKQAQLLLEILRNFNIRWLTGDEICDITDWDTYREKIGYALVNGDLGLGHIERLATDYDVVKFDEVMKEEY